MAREESTPRITTISCSPQRTEKMEITLEKWIQKGYIVEDKDGRLNVTDKGRDWIKGKWGKDWAIQFWGRIELML